jgi:STE24 endopeptidase
VSPLRATVAVAIVAVASALLLAVASRAPAHVRHATPPSGAFDPSLGARFTDGEVARHGAYRGPSYLSLALSLVVQLTLLVVLARGPFRQLVGTIERVPGGLPVHAAVAGAAVAILIALALLPLAYVRGFAIEHAWGLSTQDLGGWLSDRLRSVGVGAVIAAISALAFFAVVRWQPRVWWAIGWASFTALTALLTFLGPVVIAPLFNRFEPLPPGSLREHVLDLARAADVDVGEVLVADASRRSTTENAYVAGLGTTKRMVLYDTLVRESSEDEAAYVVAHELGHEVERHVLKNLVIASAGLLLAFGLLAWLAGREGPWAWTGAAGIGDLRAIPVLVLFSLCCSLVGMPVLSSISRSFEARADEIAIELTNDPGAAIRTQRRLAFANIADLRPPAVAVWTLFTHPPVRDRIRAAQQASGSP